MPIYKYTAFDLTRQKIKGKFIAPNEKELALQLARRNLYLISATEYKGGTPSSFFTLGTGKVKMQELTSFCRQFAILLTSGIEVVGCLEILWNQSFSRYFKSILQVICDDVKSGEMLGKALEKHKKVFPSFFISMVNVGEAGGSLDVIFVSLADYYEGDAAVKRKIKSATTYPMMLGVMTIAIVILMLAFVVPMFKNAMSSMEVEVEGFTAAVYAVSDFMVAYWQILLVCLILIVGGLVLFFMTSAGKKFRDAVKVKIPFVRKITLNVAAARFARAFSILLSSGMDTVAALETTGIILDNHYLEEKFRRAVDEVRRGMTITKAFQKYHLFPPLLIQMVAVGESSNTLDEVLTRSCRFFDEQVEISLNGLSSRLQPIMLAIMGVVVGLLFLAVYSPMLSIMTNIDNMSAGV